jgi:hypothetical protein
MMLATLALAASLSTNDTGTSPVDLIARLGSPRFAEREEATVALRSLGRDAIDPLRRARDSEDPEVQARARGLLDSIEREMVLQPTLVRVDARDRPLAQVVRDLAGQTGFDLRADLGRQPRWADREVELRTPEPISFWQALDRLGLDVQAPQPDGFRRFGDPPDPSYLVFGRGGHPLPTWQEGPFRLVARDVGLGPMAGTLPRGRFGNDARAFRAIAKEVGLRIEAELQAEPRLLLRVDGPLTLLEAIDDKGRSLLPPDPERRNQMVLAPDGPSSPSLGFSMDLDLPANPGLRVARLRARLPVVVDTRRIEPVEIPLAPKIAPGVDATPRVISNGELGIVVHGLEAKGTDGGWALDLTISPSGWRGMVLRRGMGGRQRVAFLNGELGRTLASLEVVDAEGRQHGGLTSHVGRFTQEGIRLEVGLPRDPSGRPPTRLLFHETLSEPVVLTFELRDIPIRFGR